MYLALRKADIDKLSLNEGQDGFYCVPFDLTQFFVMATLTKIQTSEVGTVVNNECELPIQKRLHLQGGKLW